MKKRWILAAACLLAAVLIGCRQGPQTEGSRSETRPETQSMQPAASDPQDGPGSSTAEQVQTPEIPEDASYHWEVEPFLEAPAVEVLCYQRPMEGLGGSLALGLVSDWPYGVFFTGDLQEPAQGLISYDGTVLPDVQGRDVMVGYDGRLSIQTESGEKELLRDGSMQDISTPEITGTNVNQRYLYDGGTGILYEGSGQDGFLPVQEAVSGVVYYAEDIDPENCYDYTNRFVVLQDGTPAFAPFEADECQNVSCNVMAVRRGDAWGYWKADGTQLLPFEYQGHQYGQAYDETGTLAFGFVNEAYPATEDTLVLYRGGETGLYDLESGEMRIPFGILEELRPVQGGKCFARSGGLWGVLELEDT